MDKEIHKLRYMKMMGVLLICIACFAGVACAGNALQIKPVQIEAFKDAHVIVIDKSGKYQIGEIDGQWSEIYDLQEKGISLLDALAETDSGVYLIGAESRLDADKNTYYTGLIVLIDSKNNTIKQWRSSTNFLHVSAFNNQLTLTSFDGIYSLNASGDIELIEENDKRQRLSSLRDGQGGLILCNSLMPTKNALFTTGEAGCSKKDKWSFVGLWYPSDETYRTAPIECGSWLIESEQSKYKAPITAVIIRDIESGRLVKKMKMPDIQRVFCINDSEIMTNNKLQSYSLPEMKPGSNYSCNKNEMILSIKKARDKLICLTPSGYVGKLKKNN